MTSLPPPAAPLRIPPAVILGLISAIILDTAVQMLWKHIVLAIPASTGLAQTLLAAASQPTAWILLALFIAQFFCWMIVLAKADLSFVQPITSLSFVTVAVCAVFFFPGREHFGPMRAVGIVLILLGVRFISQTDHRTAPLGGHRSPNPSPLGEGGPSGPGEGLRPTITQTGADRPEDAP